MDSQNYTGLLNNEHDIFQMHRFWLKWYNHSVPTKNDETYLFLCTKCIEGTYNGVVMFVMHLSVHPLVCFISRTTDQVSMKFHIGCKSYQT